MSGILYVVGTPIGNLNDLSPRALDVLENCDFIAAEDTRVTLKILNHFDIKKSLVSYHEHNKKDMGPKVLMRLMEGENCALVTDAGMPAISDPGEDLVRLCHENMIKVESVPGPTAFATAMAISGMNSRRFTFEGFLSVSKSERNKHLKEIKNEKRTMVFYEAPHKLSQTIKDLYEILGDRELSIVREITKIHEEVIKTTLSKAYEKYSKEGLKGEIVLVIAGAPEEENEEITLEQALNFAREFMAEGCPPSEAAKRAAKISGFKKGDIYKSLQEEKNNA